MKLCTNLSLSIFLLISHTFNTHAELTVGHEYIHSHTFPNSEQKNIERMFSLQDKTRTQQMPDVPLFGGERGTSDTSVVKKITRPNMTVFGLHTLTLLLNNPLTDATHIQERADIIKLLVDNDHLFDTLTAMFNNLKKEESNILSFWDSENDLAQLAVKELFWGSYLNAYNKNSSTLQLKKLQELATIPWNLAKPMLMGIGVQVILAYFNHSVGLFLLEQLGAGQRELDFIEQLMPTTSHWNVILHILYYLNPWWVYKEQQSLIHTTAGFSYCTVNNTGPFPPALAKPLHYSFTVINWLLLGWGIKNSIRAYRHVQQLAYVENRLQEKVLAVDTLFRTIKHINQTSKNHPPLQILGNQLTKALQEQKKNDDFVSVSTLFNQYESIEQDKQKFSSGQIRAGYNQIETIKNKLVPFFNIIGELESYLSIATIFRNVMKKQHETSHQQSMCFVNFVSAPTPHISLRAVWNPLIEKMAVPNDIDLGMPGKHRNITLTGSNTGGKSTLLQSIAITIWLAHIFGVSFCQEATMTIFNTILTSLHIQGNVALGESFFYAEVNRAKLIYTVLKQLSPDQFAFVIIDEMFVGTNSQVGQEAAYEFAMKLKDFSNINLIFVTHFPSLTELQEKTEGIFANFCFDIFEDEHGRLQRTYKIMKGASTQNIARALLQESLAS